MQKKPKSVWGPLMNDLRQTLGLSQEALGKKVGCDLWTVCHIEAGRRLPSVQVGEKIWALACDEEILDSPDPDWADDLFVSLGGGHTYRNLTFVLHPVLYNFEALVDVLVIDNDTSRTELLGRATCQPYMNFEYVGYFLHCLNISMDKRKHLAKDLSAMGGMFQLTTQYYRYRHPVSSPLGEVRSLRDVFGIIEASTGLTAASLVEHMDLSVEALNSWLNGRSVAKAESVEKFCNGVSRVIKKICPYANVDETTKKVVSSVRSWALGNLPANFRVRKSK